MADQRGGSETRSAVAAIRLLMLTGCRLSEIQKFRWEYVDVEAGKLRLLDSKIGGRAVPLAPSAVRLLANLPRDEDNPWMIAGKVVERNDLVLLLHQQDEQQRCGCGDRSRHGRPPAAPASAALDPSVEIRGVDPDAVSHPVDVVRGIWIVRSVLGQLFQMRSRLRDVRRDGIDGFEQLLDVRPCDGEPAQEQTE